MLREYGRINHGGWVGGEVNYFTYIHLTLEPKIVAYRLGT